MITLYEELTDDELFAEIERQYGKDWKPQDLDPESELCNEYAKRVVQGL